MVITGGPNVGPEETDTPCPAVADEAGAAITGLVGDVAIGTISTGLAATAGCGARVAGSMGRIPVGWAGRIDAGFLTVGTMVKFGTIGPTQPSLATLLSRTRDSSTSSGRRAVRFTRRGRFPRLRGSPRLPR